MSQGRLPQVEGRVSNTRGSRSSTRNSSRAPRDPFLEASRKLNAGDKLYKSNGFTNQLADRFYENNSMEASDKKARIKKLEDARKKKRQTERLRAAEEERIEWMERRLKEKERIRAERAAKERKILDSANSMQGMYRMKKARERVDEARAVANGMNFVAGKMQARYRGYTGRVVANVRKEAVFNAYVFKVVSKLQAKVRLRYVGNQLEKQKRIVQAHRDTKATAVQRIIRGKLGRGRWNRVHAKMLFDAATTVQSMARAKRGRELARVRAVFVEQLRQIEREKEERRRLEDKAATKMGSLFRRKLAYAVVATMKVERKDKSVLLMQAAMRGRMGRDRARRRKEVVEEEERELEEARIEAMREELEEQRKLEERRAAEEALRKLREREEEEKRKKEAKKAEERERLRRMVEEEEAREAEEERLAAMKRQQKSKQAPSPLPTPFRTIPSDGTENSTNAAIPQVSSSSSECIADPALAFADDFEDDVGESSMDILPSPDKNEKKEVFADDFEDDEGEKVDDVIIKQANQQKKKFADDFEDDVGEAADDLISEQEPAAEASKHVHVGLDTEIENPNDVTISARTTEVLAQTFEADFDEDMKEGLNDLIEIAAPSPVPPPSVSFEADFDEDDGEGLDDLEG